ncbi:hypothetical protein JW711_04190 [Candidatus Woesearchaeota archaeon]|nr:hypothetical protein [Candidatus Woesearchaeota archaeon]
MSSMKDDLVDIVKKDVARHEEIVRDGKALLRFLFTARTNRLHYKVTLDSLWADFGENAVVRDYVGKLADAICNAETEFKAVNNRSDVSAKYRVVLVYAGREWPIPEECWTKYASKASASSKV